MRRIFALLLLATAALAQTAFHLKPGDRVVFFGDSITDQRLYTTFVETYVVTRFPALPVTFVHSGWGGDRVSGGGGGTIDVRLERDVYAYKPTVMTVMLGMNDGRVRAFDQALFETYSNGMRSIVQNVKRSLPGIRITAIQPSPYDDVTRAPGFEGGYNAVLVRYGQFIKQLAEQETLLAADLNTSVVAALEKAKAADPALAARIVPDRVHPGPGGHLLMAAALLKAWNAPALVSDVEIDAAARRVVRAERAKAAMEEGEVLAWTQTDEALPMPYDAKDAALMLAVRSSDFIEALDRQPLKVTGLTPARYTLRIDGESIGSFTKEELAAGINLAPLDTPMARQAAEVHALTLKHNNIHAARWRQVQVPLQKDGLANTKAAMDTLDALEQEVIARQRAAAQPKPHKFVLTAE